MIQRVALLLLVLLASACSSLHPAPPPRTLVLVSLDGFRPQDLGHGMTPTLDALARGGVTSEAMRPSYPSLTFPNHYTLVTGLRPDRHGIVHNTMHDPVLGAFHTGDAAAVGDARWWGGEPLWVTAEKAGLRTATMFWPGSSAAIGGVRPSEWREYDESLSGERRVDTVLEWLGRPARARPRLVTLYFEALDEAAHDHGPASPEAQAATRALDGHLARLLHGLDALGLRDQVDLVVVSDHGMAEVAHGRVVDVDRLAPPDLVRRVTWGQLIGLQPLPGREAEAVRVLVGRHAHHECWTRETLPARWHYGRHPRVPAIVCQMDAGWDAETAERIARRGGYAAPRGSHGYDPAHPSMAALFIAAGPSFRAGTRLPAFDNVDLYPMLARLLGLVPQPHDGDPATLAPALR
ncbi:ectonucleotide pyrophosphatase/phosphodiesterase [Lysobacter sp. N42]|uniref:alkaline phosphatase family protein n=1 Tax=Lysobacter sp. N42 TaxID=2545719 RepID=UPI0010499B90|nr:ectonucleotide pyrophosphatase/phosphodiesterase [Lysobacter sp. N42]TCZ81703.1 alkaline phosphatase family protein [Lysobacter sp. N42]